MATVEERIEKLLDREIDGNKLLQAYMLLAEAAEEIPHLRKQLAAK